MRITFVLTAAFSTFLAIGLIARPAHAKVFRNAYVSFELADRWNCTLEQTEWVCRTSQPGLAEAVIILTAKEVGPQDSLSGYEAHLKAARTVVSRGGSSVQSTVYKVEQRNINSQPWIDGMHLSSEVSNYYTRYVATTKEKIAVLVTFSAHKLHYTKYSADFFRAIESLRVTATRSLMNGNGQGNGSGGVDLLGGSTNTDMIAMDGGGSPDEGSGGGSRSTAQSALGIAFVVLAIGIYLLMKRGPKGGSKGSRKRKK